VCIRDRDDPDAVGRARGDRNPEGSAPRRPDMVVADLHVHTTNSDGVLSLKGVVDAARDADLAAVAVTDHDRLHPDLDAPVVDRDGVAVVHGVELRVESEAGLVDLLGYGVHPTAALVDELDRLQTDRVERGRALLGKVEAHLGVDLDATVEPGFGRPDLARAVAAHPETDYSVQGVFDDLIGDDGPLYVAREVPGFERGRALLAEACDLVGLAHPLRYDDPAAALALVGGLDAVELHYPYADDPETAPVAAAIERHGLLVTGGSDAHGATLGRAGLSAGEWNRVRARLSTPE